MRAAVLTAPASLLEIVDDLDIEEPRSGEVLVGVKNCGICHSDVTLQEGGYAIPTVLGHEAAGVVEAVGESVRSIAVGDHVVSCASQHCGRCHWCVRGRFWLCEGKRHLGLRPPERSRLLAGEEPIGQITGLGAFAEQMLVHETALVAIDPEMPLDQAALIGCAVVTGVGAVINVARVRPGETCAVIGCGGIGLNVVQGAALAGAGRVIAVDLQPAKLDLALRFGATDVVSAADGDAVQGVLDLTGGRGVDHAFEAIGLKATAEQALHMTSMGGSAYLIGVVPVGVNIEVEAATFALGGRSLHGVRMGASNIASDFPRFVELYQQGRLLLDELIAERITLAEVNDGYERMRAGDQARSVIVFDGSE